MEGNKNTELQENGIIDREEELEILKESIDLLESESKGGVIILSGETGIGKTFLVRSLKDHIEGRGFNWLESVCISRDAEPFNPLIESFSLFVEEQKKPYLNLPMSIGMFHRKDEMEDIEKIFNKSDRTIQRAMDFIEDITDTTPMVLFIEDMQLADKYTLLFIRYLSANMGSNKLLLICAYRPEDATDHNFLKETLNFMFHRKLHKEINLKPFGMDHTRELILSITGVDPPNYFVEVFHQSTDGNPLFMVETLRSMLTNDIIDPSEGRYISEPDEIEWPTVVRYTLERKIIKLDDATKNFLQYISILRPDFSFTLVAEYVNMDEMDVLDAIDTLLDFDILKETNKSERYKFSHHAVKDILLENQSSGKRRLLHKKAAEAIKACYKDNLTDYYENLGYHSSSARLHDEAVEYYYKAARNYEDDGDVDNAIDNYLKVDRLSQKYNIRDVVEEDYLERAGELLYKKGSALIEEGDSDVGRECIEKAMNLFERIGMEQRTDECRKLFDGML